MSSIICRDVIITDGTKREFLLVDGDVAAVHKFAEVREALVNAKMDIVFPALGETAYLPLGGLELRKLAIERMGANTIRVSMPNAYS
jgi:hypothetical protein